MARPKKDKNLRHTRHIMLRLTNTEYEIIAENAKADLDNLEIGGRNSRLFFMIF